ncbi:hypothetical protein ERL64_16345 [Hafnia alvei]|nr:hypothetical protein ERL64_16345 [Hafnia alvei]
MGGLTGRDLRFSLIISQLMAKAIPVRGAIFNALHFERNARRFSFLDLKFYYSQIISCGTCIASTPYRPAVFQPI